MNRDDYYIIVKILITCYALDVPPRLAQWHPSVMQCLYLRTPIVYRCVPV